MMLHDGPIAVLKILALVFVISVCWLFLYVS